MISSPYLYVFGSVIFTVYGQLVIKWQTGKVGEFPADGSSRIRYGVDLFTNPWVISAFLVAGLAAICWIIALSKLELSRAYPFISASFVLVLVLSAVFFSESLNAPKVLGGLLIVAGLILGSRG